MARLNHQNSEESDEEELIIKPLKTKLDVFWLLVPVLSTISVASVVVSVCTNGWLHTMERMPNPLYNGTGDMEFLSKRTVSGLWTYCFTNRKLTATCLTASLWGLSFVFTRWAAIYKFRIKAEFPYLIPLKAAELNLPTRVKLVIAFSPRVLFYFLAYFKAIYQNI